NDFERAAAADKRREALGAAAAGMHADSDFRVAQERVLARRKPHITGEHEFAADPTDAASNLRDAGHRRSGDAHERVCQYRQAGRSDRGRDIAGLAGQVEVGEEELRIRALEDYDT